MANRRTYQLGDAINIADYYFLVDKVGSSEAEKYPADSFYTKTELAASGGASVHYDNITNLPTGSAAYYTLLNQTGAQEITISNREAVVGVALMLDSGTSATVKCGWTVGGEEILRLKTVTGTDKRGYQMFIPTPSDETVIHVTITGYASVYVLTNRYKDAE